MSELFALNLVGSQSDLPLAPVAPGYLGCLCIQVEVGDRQSQLAALSALQPRLEDALQAWLSGHPGASREAFVAALDHGDVSAADLGLYALSTAADVAAAAHQLADVLRFAPAFAARLGVR